MENCKHSSFQQLKVKKTSDFYNKCNCKIKVDLSKIPDCDIIDVSKGQGLTGKTKRFAIKDQEVLIRNGIPKGSYEAIE